MADLKSGKIVAKAVARARIEGVDSAPTAVFGDSSAWTKDSSIQAYVAAGVGSRENLIGTGRDDATDMLDRRVELKPIVPCV